ncbi:MAG: response regulator [Calditrichia bacterium]|nr:response regulator [Calditrichia bacterium]
MENKPIKKKVLIVDDEEYLRQILVDVMEINDIESIAVDEGQKALEVYKKEKNEIGLVLLDLILPKETGVDTYKNLCKINPDVKVIFMSGLGDKDTLRTIPNYNEFIFLKKPFSMDEVTEKVVMSLT